MEVTKVQAILSVLVVGVFLATTSLIVVVPMIGGYPLEGPMEILKTFASIYSGVIGLIIGFYFGKSRK